MRLITRLNAGGPARHVIWLTKGMTSLGYETRLVAGRVPPGEDDLSDFARQEGVTVEEIPNLSREIDPGRDLQALSRIAAHIREFRPHIVHTHTSKAGLLGRLASRQVNRAVGGRGRPIRVVHTFHGNVLSGYFSRAKTRLLRAMECFLARHATDRILVLSPQQRTEVVDRFRVAPREKVFIVPLALDLTGYREMPARGGLRRSLGLSEDDFLVGIVGRIAPVKDHELFLRSAAALAKEVRRARFLIVGAGKGLESARALAGFLGIGQWCHFLGVRTDLPSIYADLDAVALTSRNEGTPLSLIEAMAAGKPIAATDVGGVRDLLTLEWTGDVASREFAGSVKPRALVISDRDPAAFAAGLARIASSPSLARELGEAGRDHAFRFHDLPRLFHDLDRIYRLPAER